MLDLLRNISLHNTDLKSGIWNKRMGSLLTGKTLGIIGFGSIGKHLAKITSSFGLNYLINDIKINNKYKRLKNFEFCNLEKLFNNSDIISVHTNLTDKSKDLINYSLLSKMKPTAFLINTSRGEVINEKDLIKILNKNMIAGVALDVYDKEPYEGKLVEYDNCITTPHIASYAQEIRLKMELEAVSNLISGLKD